MKIGALAGSLRKPLPETLDAYAKMGLQGVQIGVNRESLDYSDEQWKEIREHTAKYNEEGRFLVYLGYEWSGTTPQGGDHNVYFLKDSDKFYPSSNWTATSVDNSNNANPITELHDKLKGRSDVLLIPHIGGRYANLDFFNPDFSSVIEIHSHHGTFEWFAFDAMRKRMKVGFIAASDDHTCRPGLSYPLSGHGKSASGAFDVASGFTGVFAPALTKKAIWDAIRKRHSMPPHSTGSILRHGSAACSWEMKEL